MWPTNSVFAGRDLTALIEARTYAEDDPMDNGFAVLATLLYESAMNVNVFHRPRYDVVGGWTNPTVEHLCEWFRRYYKPASDEAGELCLCGEVNGVAAVKLSCLQNKVLLTEALLTLELADVVNRIGRRVAPAAEDVMVTDLGRVSMRTLAVVTKWLFTPVFTEVGTPLAHWIDADGVKHERFSAKVCR